MREREVEALVNDVGSSQHRQLLQKRLCSTRWSTLSGITAFVGVLILGYSYIIKIPFWPTHSLLAIKRIHNKVTICPVEAAIFSELQNRLLIQTHFGAAQPCPQSPAHILFRIIA